MDIERACHRRPVRSGKRKIAARFRIGASWLHVSKPRDRATPLDQRGDAFAHGGEALVLRLAAQPADVDLLQDDGQLEGAPGLVPDDVVQGETGARGIARDVKASRYSRLLTSG